MTIKSLGGVRGSGARRVIDACRRLEQVDRNPLPRQCKCCDASNRPAAGDQNGERGRHDRQQSGGFGLSPQLETCVTLAMSARLLC